MSTIKECGKENNKVEKKKTHLNFFDPSRILSIRDGLFVVNGTNC